MTVQIVVVAKEPAPGRAKTRLCPPYTPDQAARIAHAALADTLDAVTRTRAARRTLLLHGRFGPPAGWHIVPQRGDGLAARLANGFADTAMDAAATVLIGMDTPQVTPALLDAVSQELSTSDAVIGLAHDGGWWVLGLNDPAHARVLAEVPMSRPDTGALTYRALAAQGLTIALAPVLRDVDTAEDVPEVARQCPPGSRFAAALERV